ncbi:transketolase family protein [Saccharopolyspora hattusasensis]|uniref:transketolase family protein n=1 Tax=Saccharopolyspora hattusasensis TaxID=1128679 RepID=UPI003D97F0AC
MSTDISTPAAVADTPRKGARGGSWQLTNMLEQAPGLEVLAGTLADLADEGVPLAVGTADLKYSNGLVRFEERHPDRFFQFGISEQNMVSAAAGLAANGLQTYVATFASFLALLCAEQIRTDLAYTKLPVRLIGHHAGFLLGFYGTSHHATEDLAITRSMANMTVLAPADENQLAALLRATTTLEGPAYIRIGRGREPQVYSRAELAELRLGKAIVDRIGGELTIVATGSMVHPSREAVRTLRAEGRDVGFVDMHTVKPLDSDAVAAIAAADGTVLSVEEHNVIGGLGSALAEVFAESAHRPRLIRHGVPDCYAPVGPPTHLYRHFDLDAVGITRRARAALDGGEA